MAPSSTATPPTLRCSRRYVLWCNGQTSPPPSLLTLQLAEEKLCFPPYAKPMYSNLGFSLLGRVFARTAGTTWEKHVKTAVFDPIGMASTGTEFTPDVKSRMAVGYVGEEEAPLYNLGWNNPCGQAYSTARDLAQFIISTFIPLDDVALPAASQANKRAISVSSGRDMALPAYINRDFQSGFASPFELNLQNGYMVRHKGMSSHALGSSLCGIVTCRRQRAGVLRGHCVYP